MYGIDSKKVYLLKIAEKCFLLVVKLDRILLEKNAKITGSKKINATSVEGCIGWFKLERGLGL